MFFTATLNQDRDYEPEQINEFEIIRELGSGGFSVVYLANRHYIEDGGKPESTHFSYFNLEGKQNKYALKAMKVSLLKKDKFPIFSVDRKQETITALQKVYMEIHFMAKLSHPNVVNIYEFIQQDDKDDIY
jgi:serine/threonine protein kinase